MSNEDLGPYSPYRLLGELEEIMEHHDGMLRALKTACIKVKSGRGSVDLVERRIQMARKIRGKILLSLRVIERSIDSLDSSLAMDISAMMAYIEMSATKDEKRYLVIARKILSEKGLQIDIERDLAELEEIARSARKISEKFMEKAL